MSEVPTSRRDVMRSLVILPSIIATPAAAAPALICTPAEATDLPAMIAEYWRTMDEYDRHPVHALHLTDPNYERVNAASNAIHKRAVDLQMHILNTPSRSGADVGLKLDMILKDYEDCVLPDDLIAIVAKDAHRLGGRAEA
jgi:hypothetical protein